MAVYVDFENSQTVLFYNTYHPFLLERRFYVYFSPQVCCHEGCLYHAVKCNTACNCQDYPDPMAN
jgi:hypothetical protein